VRRQFTFFSLALWGALAALVSLASPRLAAADDPTESHEEAGRSREGYSWGAAPAEAAAAPAFHRYGTFFATLGAGGTVRIVAHADICDPGQPGREGCRFSPPYLQLRAGWLFEADGDFQHGVGLGVATNLSTDGLLARGLDPGGQWVLSPAYHFRWWLAGPWVQLAGHVGVPLAISNVTGYDPSGESYSETAFNWGLELEAQVIFKFLQGLGVYFSTNLGTYFGGTGSTWPTISFEGGLNFDYEVLP
jgi:hypothetical protein